MGYTLSFTASVKVGRCNVTGLLHHDARDVDKQNGLEVKHSNKGIEAARTAENETLVSDGNGSWIPCSSIQQIEAAIDARLATVKKPLRKDAVVLRPVVLQLDPEWYEAHQDERERAAAAEDMLSWAADTFGPENIVYASLHNDEGNPHMHVGVCPVTQDGRLAQKDWFPDPKALREMHQSFRESMADAGYDIDMKRRKPGKHAKRMSVEEYKDFQDLQREQRKLESQSGTLSRWGNRLQERSEAIVTREQELEARKQQLEARERELAAKETRAAEREATLHNREMALEGRRKAVEAREANLPGLVTQAAKKAVEDEIRAAEAQRRAASANKAVAATRDAIAKAWAASEDVKQPGRYSQPGLSR